MMYSSSNTSLAGRIQELEDFFPTPDQINNLPEGIRRYVADLQTQCDPSGDIQSLRIAQENAAALLIENEELRSEIARLQGLRSFRGETIRRDDGSTYSTGDMGQ